MIFHIVLKRRFYRINEPNLNLLSVKKFNSLMTVAGDNDASIASFASVNERSMSHIKMLSKYE